MLSVYVCCWCCSLKSNWLWICFSCFKDSIPFGPNWVAGLGFIGLGVRGRVDWFSKCVQPQCQIAVLHHLCGVKPSVVVLGLDYFLQELCSQKIPPPHRWQNRFQSGRGAQIVEHEMCRSKLQGGACRSWSFFWKCSLKWSDFVYYFYHVNHLNI